MQNDLLAYTEARYDLRFRSVADAGSHRHAPASAFSDLVRDLDFKRPVLLVNDGPLGNRQYSLARLQHDLGIGRHGSHQFP